MHESLVQSLGKNEMSVPWRANWSRVHGPSSENRGVSWAISWFLMEIGLRPRCSSTGKAHRVKKAHHFWHDRNRCCWKIGNCFFFFCNYFKCILHWTNDLRSFCVQKLKILFYLSDVDAHIVYMLMKSYDPLVYGLKILQTRHRGFF